MVGRGKKGRFADMKHSRFVTEPNDMRITQCVGCAHYYGSLKCLAFPAGIPEPILDMEHDHRKPYVNDHGVRFRPLDGVEVTE
jgi:hypothetical protein